ncbi:hypothetical protein HanIR_Chr01g0004501 [Helianthus annuus]|nr:hypothetical protein HanIR_Chr01g0004501 [Helianthus annuus]
MRLSVSMVNGFRFTIVFPLFELGEFLARTGLLPLLSTTPRSFLGLADGEISLEYLRFGPGDRHGFMWPVFTSSERKLGSYTKFRWLSLVKGLLQCNRPLNCNASRICLSVSRSFACSSIPLSFKLFSESTYTGTLVCFGSGNTSAVSKKLLLC